MCSSLWSKTDGNAATPVWGLLRWAKSIWWDKTQHRWQQLPSARSSRCLRTESPSDLKAKGPSLQRRDWFALRVFTKHTDKLELPCHGKKKNQARVHSGEWVNYMWWCCRWLLQISLVDSETGLKPDRLRARKGSAPARCSVLSAPPGKNTGTSNYTHLLQVKHGFFSPLTLETVHQSYVNSHFSVFTSLLLQSYLAPATVRLSRLAWVTVRVINTLLSY